jgi:hypothetical protein
MADFRFAALNEPFAAQGMAASRELMRQRSVENSHNNH